MPSFSSSAMCLSRAMGSRPVQPAITAWSIGKVNGTVAPSASTTVKVRSNMERALHAGGQFEDAAIRAAGRGQHQADRHFAVAVRRQRDRATVDRVDQGAIAKRAQILNRERLVVGEIGNLWRGIGGG